MPQYQQLGLTTSQLRERHFGFIQGLYKKQATRTHPETYALYAVGDLHVNFRTDESLI